MQDIVGRAWGKSHSWACAGVLCLGLYVCCCNLYTVAACTRV